MCFWEDDLAKLRWPDLAGGANSQSLIDAQKNYANHGVRELRFISQVRRPRDNEPVDAGWRPADVDEDVETPPTHSYPDDRLMLYWWRSDYWRRSS
ncbi:hypothetical protein GCM10028798_11120 [Humibacter antri]